MNLTYTTIAKATSPSPIAEASAKAAAPSVAEASTEPTRPATSAASFKPKSKVSKCKAITVELCFT